MIGPIKQNAIRILARTTGAWLKELRIQNVKLKNIEKKGKNESKSGVNSCFFVVNLKKQSQFPNGQNEFKYLYEREI